MTIFPLQCPRDVNIRRIGFMLQNSPSGEFRLCLSSIPTTGKMTPGACEMLKGKLESSSHQRAKNIPCDKKREVARDVPHSSLQELKDQDCGWCSLESETAAPVSDGHLDRSGPFYHSNVHRILRPPLENMHTGM